LASTTAASTSAAPSSSKFSVLVEQRDAGFRGGAEDDLSHVDGAAAAAGPDATEVEGSILRTAVVHLDLEDEDRGGGVARSDLQLEAPSGTDAAERQCHQRVAASKTSIAVFLRAAEEADRPVFRARDESEAGNGGRIESQATAADHDRVERSRHARDQLGDGHSAVRGIEVVRVASPQIHSPEADLDADDHLAHRHLAVTVAVARELLSRAALRAPENGRSKAHGRDLRSRAARPPLSRLRATQLRFRSRRSGEHRVSLAGICVRRTPDELFLDAPDLPACRPESSAQGCGAGHAGQLLQARGAFAQLEHRDASDLAAAKRHGARRRRARSRAGAAFRVAEPRLRRVFTDELSGFRPQRDTRPESPPSVRPPRDEPSATQGACRPLLGGGRHRDHSCM
jgi:hypothetical protein